MKKFNNSKEIFNKARNMRLVMESLFSESDKISLSNILNDFKTNKSIPWLVENIQPYLDSKTKLIFLRYLNDLIPESGRETFQEECAVRGLVFQSNQDFQNKRLSKRNSTYPRKHTWEMNLPSQDYNDDEDEEYDQQKWQQQEFHHEIPVIRNKTRNHIPRPTINIDVSSSKLDSRHLFISRLCRLSNERCESYVKCLPVWGINLWRSHATYFLYIINTNEEALYKNNDFFEHHIKIGQKLKQINEKEVSELDDYALNNIFEQSTTIDLILQGEGVSIESISEMSGFDYKWIDCVNDSSSGPPVFESIDHKRLKPIELIIGKENELGINIRGGREFNLGIYISSVKKDSIASLIGLQVGDKLLQINSLGLTGANTPSNNNSVKIIKESLIADLWVYTLHKIPLTSTASDVRSKSLGRSGWNNQVSEPQGMFLRGQRSQLIHVSLTQPSVETIESQLSDHLRKQDVNKVLFLLEKYQDFEINARQLAAAIHQAINGVWKKKLVLIIMNTLRPTDRLQFHMQLEVINAALSVKNIQLDTENESNYSIKDDNKDEKDIVVTRSKNKSGLIEEEHLEKKNHIDYISSHEIMNESISCELENSIELNSNDNLILQEIDYSDDQNRPEVSVPAPPPIPQTEPKKDDFFHSEHKLPKRKSNINEPFKFIIPKDEILAKNRKTNLVIVPKTVAQLGISIEGGVNTLHPLPRIVKIQKNGCADLCGEIEEGDIILEVNNDTLAGLEHSKIARKIAEAFNQAERDSIEFLIIKPNLNKDNEQGNQVTEVLYI